MVPPWGRVTDPRNSYNRVWVIPLCDGAWVPGAEEGSYDGREDEASCGVKGMWAITYPLWMEVDACLWSWR